MKYLISEAYLRRLSRFFNTTNNYLTDGSIHVTNRSRLRLFLWRMSGARARQQATALLLLPARSGLEGKKEDEERIPRTIKQKSGIFSTPTNLFRLDKRLILG